MADRLGQLILAGAPEAAISSAQRAQDAIEALNSYEDLDLCICELYFEDGDALALLSAVRTRFRRARVIIVTAYDLQNFADYIQGLTLFPLPLDRGRFRRDLPRCAGHPGRPGFFTVSPRQEAAAGSLGRLLRRLRHRGEARRLHHHGRAPLPRRRTRSGLSVRPWPWRARGIPTCRPFIKPVNMMAAIFFAREKWDNPNLSEMATAGTRVDDRLAARIIQMVGSVIIFWDANGFPHSAVGAVDVSVLAAKV